MTINMRIIYNLGEWQSSWSELNDYILDIVKALHDYNRPTQSCSCLFVSGRTVVYRSHYKRPQFPPKIDFGSPNYRLQRLRLRLRLTGPAGLCWRLDRPGRTPSTCVAWQLQHWLLWNHSPYPGYPKSWLVVVTLNQLPRFPNATRMPRMTTQQRFSFSSIVSLILQYFQ